MAKRVRFLKDGVFEERNAHGTLTKLIEYRKGVEDTVLDSVADAAIAAGNAELVSDRTPNKRERERE